MKPAPPSWTENYEPKTTNRSGRRNYGPKPWMLVRYMTLPDVDPQVCRILGRFPSAEHAYAEARIYWRKKIPGVYVRWPNKTDHGEPVQRPSVRVRRLPYKPNVQE